MKIYTIIINEVSKEVYRDSVNAESQEQALDIGTKYAKNNFKDWYTVHAILQ